MMLIFSSFPYTEPSLSKSLMLDVRLLDVYVFVKIKYFSLFLAFLQLFFVPLQRNLNRIRNDEKEHFNYKYCIGYDDVIDCL